MMTISETELLAFIRQRGEVVSLFAAATELQMPYETAHRCISKLNHRGLVKISNRRAGAPLVITPAGDLRDGTDELKLLQALRRLGECSAQELSRATGLHYKRVLRMINSFDRAGLVDVQRRSSYPCTLMIVAR